MQPPATPRKLTPTNLVWKAYVDLQLQNGEFVRQPLLDQHCVIGRSPNLQITLDHDTVSRRHAELFCDPFGRWWIRDLGSTNGTVVNGERVTEKVLQPGDRVGVGDYSLFFNLLAPPDTRPELHSDSGESPILEQDDDLDSPTFVGNPSWVRSLSDLEPPKIAATHLSTLMEFSRRLMSLESADDRLTAMCQMMVSDEFHGILAMVLRLRPQATPNSQAASFADSSTSGPISSVSIHTSMRVLCGPVRPEGYEVLEGEHPYISRRVIREVQETGRAALASNLPRDSASLELTLSAEVAPLCAVACPLAREDGNTDLLYVTLPPQYGSVEWLALISLAVEAYQQSESAWAARQHEQAHAAIERELETARQIQQALITTELDHAGMGVWVDFEPCKWVGGDYVDAVPMQDGRVLLAVADVCGKGLQAALVTFSVHTMIRATADVGRSLPDMMDRLNRHLCDYLPSDSFVTMVCVAVDPTTGDLECLNAGHMAPLLVSPNGRIRRLQSQANSVVGVAPMPMTSQKAQMAKGELLVLYTDGLTELRNASREMLGEKALSEGLARLYRGRPRNAALADVAGDLKSMLSEFSGDQVPEDDRAFLLARR